MKTKIISRIRFLIEQTFFSKLEIITAAYLKKDSRTIYNYASEKSKRVICKITRQVYCDDRKRIIFNLKLTGIEVILEKTAEQIFLDKALLTSMSLSDLQTICYIAGYEHSQG